MKSNLSDIVSKYLFSYGKVSIPGIGTFSITDSSSGFKLENDVLTPPTKMVQFSEDVADEEALIKYLKSNHGHSRKEAEKAISDYSKQCLNDLLNYGVANIPGIGRLSKYASGEIVFDPAKEYLITSNYMLPQIKLTPIDNTRIVKDLVPKQRPVVPIAAAAAIPTAVTTAAFLSNIPKDKPQPKPVVTKPIVTKPIVTKPAAPAKVAEPRVIKPQVSKPIVEAKKQIKPVDKATPVVKKEPVRSAPIKQTPPPVVYEEERSFFSEWKWPLIIGILLLCALVFGIKMCNKYVSGEEISISNPLADNDSAEATKGKDGEMDIDDYLKDKPKLQKYAKYLTPKIVEEGCVIIVGTFKKSRNVIRMKDKLMRAGLDPYTESHQGMTRVGVLFTCEEHDLEDYIHTLRKSFDRGAWYLNPEMDVARK